MAPEKRTILITGCSEGSLGDALAQELHNRGQRVFATARNPDKIAHFADLGIETLLLDVQSPASIAAAVAAVADKTGGSLDMLINNSGGGYSIPLLDADIDEARQLFDLNYFSLLAVTQAFVPLLLKSTRNPTVVNNSSVLSFVPFPLSGIYCSSKAAVGMLSDILRLELKPFGVRVVELKTGAVRSGFFTNQKGGGADIVLPEGSLYNVAKEQVEEVMSGRMQERDKMERDVWAPGVASDLLAANPPIRSWRGKSATLSWILSWLPLSWLEGPLLRHGAMDVVKRNLQKAGDVKNSD